MTNSINNIGPAGGITPPSNTPTTTQVGTPDANTVNALNNQLSTNAPTAAGTSPAATSGNGISAENMKIFMDEVNKFCVQQGIATTPKPTRD